MINWLLIIGSAIVIEIFTMILRVSFRQNAKGNYGRIMRKWRFKKFLQPHHLYTGLVLSLISYFFGWIFLFNLGLGISLSDFLHHLLLKVFTGKSDFYVFQRV